MRLHGEDIGNGNGRSVHEGNAAVPYARLRLHAPDGLERAAAAAIDIAVGTMLAVHLGCELARILRYRSVGAQRRRRTCSCCPGWTRPDSRRSRSRSPPNWPAASPSAPCFRFRRPPAAAERTAPDTVPSAGKYIENKQLRAFEAAMHVAMANRRRAIRRYRDKARRIASRSRSAWAWRPPVLFDPPRNRSARSPSARHRLARTFGDRLACDFPCCCRAASRRSEFVCARFIFGTLLCTGHYCADNNERAYSLGSLRSEAHKKGH